MPFPVLFYEIITSRRVGEEQTGSRASDRIPWGGYVTNDLGSIGP